MKFKKVLLGFFMTSLVFLSSCSLPGLTTNSGKNSISVASQASTEAQIMAGMVKGMVEHYTNLKVNTVNNLGTTTVVHQAMMNNDVSISAVRYTGTDLTGTLQEKPTKDPKKALKVVQTEFQKRYHQKWYPSYGFANTYAFMVTKETAEKYHLKTISDLKKVPNQLTAGVDTSWMNRDGDGYKAFIEEYGVQFKKAYPMQIGLVYDAVHAGKMDVVLGYSTDGRIASYDLVMLEDDLHFFPPYDASPVATDAILKEHPELEKVLSRLEGTINTETMQKLNYRADNDLLEPEVVAKEFLAEHNYFEDKGGE
ncbi:osmoprotectant ABC transporter substrate-binding protein [Vagococcus entomophilus]|uniref:Osmoprotectant ABC transporter substrate-binding protein n=1 Tax=Vagococcus entomophilus TaxID=1160095 RepID=A0A430AII8_9ENTE|nr:osmoprotectant ABC transporter substrate-binding protein [Vagococcus entomophilus]RSU07848.1 osmoprotectant ABC transporter substrate-binding protein [Vagococcus entomophilus]